MGETPYFSAKPNTLSLTHYSNLLTIPAIVKKRCKIKKTELLPQRKKGSKNQKIKPQNPWKGLFPRISAVFHCINFVVAMFLYTCGHFPDKRLKFLSLKIAPKVMLRYIVSNCQFYPPDISFIHPVYSTLLHISRQTSFRYFLIRKKSGSQNRCPNNPNSQKSLVFCTFPLSCSSTLDINTTHSTWHERTGSTPYAPLGMWKHIDRHLAISSVCENISSFCRKPLNNN